MRRPGVDDVYATPSDAPPLVVDLDGTLTCTDLLHESTLRLVHDRPHLLLALPWWLAKGKAALKRHISERAPLDVKMLPYDDDFVSWLRSERESGRKLVLCTASDERYAKEVADTLGLFDAVIASDGSRNMSASRKAETLKEYFGEKGYDYAGNSRADIPVWASARRAVVVAAPPAVGRAASEVTEVEREFTRKTGGLRTWVRALRVYQWLKNMLLFLPLLGAHRLLETDLLIDAVLAFVSFGLCASSVYVVNDLLDLESDRHHPRKSRRPFACGALSIRSGVLVSGVLWVASFGLALLVGREFTLWLAIYFLLTAAYSITLKSRVIFDAIALAILFTLRILAGGAAVGIAPSFWLLAFSLFLFLSLAFVKRYTELLTMAAQGVTGAHGRGYRSDDLPFVQTLGVSAGFMAVLVMALYINGDTVQTLYATPELMWINIPLLLYWSSRMWIKAHRGEMHDDPIVYALRDHISLACGAIFLGVLWLAS